MTIPSKIAGGAGLISYAVDIHKTALIYSRNEGVTKKTNAFIAKSLGSQKANRISYKDANRKKILSQENFSVDVKGFFGKIKGYFHGLAIGAAKSLPNIVLSIGAIGIKNKTAANISAIGLAILELYDFIKNSTSIFERTDYLER